MSRVKLTEDQRNLLIYTYCDHNNMSLIQLAKICNINYFTFKKYVRGKRFIPYDLVNMLCNLNGIDPRKINFQLFEDNWGKIKGGQKGIKTLYNNYPKKIEEWRRKGGYQTYKSNFEGYSTVKRIKTPTLSESLAEFIGIILGDGTLTYYFARISADTRFEKPYFDYINNLAYKLFGIKGKITEKENNLYLTISSRKLSSFLNKKFKLPYGDKIRNEAKIPAQILKKKSLVKCCLRGLVDTDGCIGKSGVSLKLSFSSHNPILLNQVIKINEKLSIFNKNYKNSLETCSIEKIKRYIRLVGTANLKHIIRFNERIKGGKLLYNRDLQVYYPLYSNIDVPFHGPVV